MKPLLTEKTAAKKARNEKVIAKYKELFVPGSQRVPVAEAVAEELGLKYSLVMRVTKDIKLF